MRGLVAPHDLAAERAVIGALLVSEPAGAVVFDMLKARDFYSQTHRVIFEAALRLFTRGEPVDQITLSGELTSVNEYESVGGRAYVFELVESVPTAANARRYAELVRGKALLRSIIDAAERIKQGAYDDPEDVMSFADEAERMLYEVMRDPASEGALLPLASDASEALEDLQRLYEAGADLTGVSSGFRDLDAMTSGYQDGDLIILAARPSMGKTAKALQTMWNLAKGGVPGAIFSLEMGRKQLVQRLNSQESGVPLGRIRTGRLEATDWTQIIRSTATLADAPLYIDDTSGVSVAAMRSRLRRLHSRIGRKVGMVMVDYIGLMTGSGNARNREQEVAEISRSLKNLAREFDVPVLALAQLSRACEQRHDKRPVLSDLRDSGGQEQDADLVTFLYRDEYYNPDSLDRGIAEVIIGKARNGPTGQVKLAWIASQARFGSLARDAG